MHRVFIHEIGNKVIVVYDPGNYINGGGNEGNKKSGFKCLSKADDAPFIFISLIFYSYKNKGEGNKHGGIPNQHAVVIVFWHLVAFSHRQYHCGRYNNSGYKSEYDHIFFHEFKFLIVL